MHEKKRRTRLRLFAIGLALFGLPAAASAAPPAANPGGCTASHGQAVELVNAGQLLRAREAYTRCAAATCGGLITQQCRAGLQRLETDVPSIIFVVTDDTGAPLTDVRVSMDGNELATRTDGRSVDVDPGLHQFTVSNEASGSFAEQILVVQGQRNRVINVRLKHASAASATGSSAVATAGAASGSQASHEPLAASDEAKAAAGAKTTAPESDAAVAPAPEKASPLLAYIVGGAGLAAIGGSLLLVHWAHEDNLRLDQCAPNCSQDSVDHVSNMYLAADITLGVGVVALGTATWLYLSRPDREESSADSAYRFDIQPRRSGAFATFGSVF